MVNYYETWHTSERQRANLEGADYYRGQHDYLHNADLYHEELKARVIKDFNLKNAR